MFLPESDHESPGKWMSVSAYGSLKVTVPSAELSAKE
jgi:hypothetical protein